MSCAGEDGFKSDGSMGRCGSGENIVIAASRLIFGMHIIGKDRKGSEVVQKGTVSPANTPSSMRGLQYVYLQFC